MSVNKAQIGWDKSSPDRTSRAWKSFHLQSSKDAGMGWVEDEGGWKNALVFNILHELQWEGCHGWLG